MFVALQGLIACGIYGYLEQRQPPQMPPAFAVVQSVSYGSINGVGLITDAEKMAIILDSVNNIVYLNDDARNVPTGGGLELTIFEGETIRRFSMSNGDVVKNYQDPDVNSWYRIPTELITLLRDCIQENYYVEW